MSLGLSSFTGRKNKLDHDIFGSMEKAKTAWSYALRPPHCIALRRIMLKHQPHICEETDGTWFCGVQDGAGGRDLSRFVTVWFTGAYIYMYACVMMNRYEWFYIMYTYICLYLYLCVLFFNIFLKEQINMWIYIYIYLYVHTHTWMGLSWIIINLVGWLQHPKQLGDLEIIAIPPLEIHWFPGGFLRLAGSTGKFLGWQYITFFSSWYDHAKHTYLAWSSCGIDVAHLCLFSAKLCLRRDA